MTKTQKWVVGIIIGLIILKPTFATFSWVGFNALFYIDNFSHLKDSFAPIVMWILLGFLAGGLIGLLVAVKLLKLDPKVSLLGISVVITLLIISGFISEPLLTKRVIQNSENKVSDSLAQLENAMTYHTVGSENVYMRSRPNIHSRIVAKLSAGTAVTVSDMTNRKWYKVKWAGQEGYINATLLTNEKGGVDLHTSDTSTVVHKMDNPEGNINGSSNNSTLVASEYRFPQSSEKLLDVSDLSGLSKYDLKIMRNEIFARHGFIFKTRDMSEYFSSRKWYKGQYYDVSSMLSELEKQNIATIKKYE